MYYICWTENNENKWELIDGEDAMQEFVSDLEERGFVTIVFNADDEIE